MSFLFGEETHTDAHGFVGNTTFNHFYLVFCCWMQLCVRVVKCRTSESLQPEKKIPQSSVESCIRDQGVKLVNSKW